MDDRQRLEEHALGRRRLVASTVHGSGWRQRPKRGAVRPVLSGLVLALLIAVGLGMANYVGHQLAKQRQEQRLRQRAPAVRFAPAVPSGGTPAAPRAG
jgi:hypothetical protein